MAASTGHAYEDSQSVFNDSETSITTDHAAFSSLAGEMHQGSSIQANHAQLHDAGYVDPEWSFSTTTETQPEATGHLRQSKAEGQLTVSSNPTSLADSAEKDLNYYNSSINTSSLLSNTLPTTRPSLSTIAQLPESSYLSALSGSSPVSQPEIPTLAQLHLPESQSLPLTHPPTHCGLGESQQTVSERTESQPSQIVERKRKSSAPQSLPSHATSISKNSSIETPAEPLLMSSGTDGHHSKKCRSEGLCEGVASDKSASQFSQPRDSSSSSFTIPSTLAPTSVIKSPLVGQASSQPRELPTSPLPLTGPGLDHGTQDMIMQTSSAPSVYLPSSASQPAPTPLRSINGMPVEVLSVSRTDKSVSQGRGLPIRRPWHGRAGSSSTSVSRHVSSITCAELPEAPSAASKGQEACEVVEKPRAQAEQAIPKPNLNHETPPSPVSIDSRDDQAPPGPDRTVEDGEEVSVDREPSPESTDNTPGVATKRLFIRDGKLYYLATVRVVGDDTMRVDFDDGSYSEVARKSLQRSAVDAKLHPGDILVSNSPEKKGIHQRYIYVGRRGFSSSEDIPRHAIVTVRPDAARHTSGSGKEVSDDKHLQIPVSSLALVAGPNLQEKNRTINLDQVFPISETYRAPVAPIHPRGRSDLFKGIGMLFTSMDTGTSGVAPQEVAVSYGAIVIENFDDIVQLVLSKASDKGKDRDTEDAKSLWDLDKISLISRSHVTTPKYLQALALGVPCVSALWLEDCTREQEQLCWKRYALGAGCSHRTSAVLLGIQANVVTRSAFDLKALLEQQQGLSMFSRKHLVYLHEDDATGVRRAELASVLFRLLGGGQVTLRPVNKSIKIPSLVPSTVLLLDGPTSALNKFVCKAVEPYSIRSWQWFKDCIVSGRVVPSD